jgi:hypothetical protein
MLHPERLFVNRTAPKPVSKSTPRTDADWTGKPWVYCPTAASLRTGEGCQGTITRQDWIKSRGTICPRMVRSYSTTVLNGTDGDPMARTSFCSIDNTTMAVCTAIGNARQLLIQANCIARGDPECMPSPFVYHPASYEPSNNAWVHDSVKSFYKHLNPIACPQVSKTDTQLIQFARAYQRSCPANGVNILAGVLQAVRSVIVDVSLLLTTMISMAFNALRLFAVSGRTEARRSIAKNWAYIRNKARSSVDAVGDILVDTLLNSGEAGAKIMSFLRKTCDVMNDAAEWFLNVWCNYVQKYTLQLLAGIRKFIGISGAVFDILQDFMDEVFKGILPAAFVAKYATQAFQNSLVELYSQPSDKKKANKVSVDVPDTANPHPVSRTAEKKSALSRAWGYSGRVVKGLAKASLYATAGLGVVEAVQGIYSIVAEEKLRDLYPENFTLFDLSDIVDVVDDMEDFILSPLSQQTCATYQIMRKSFPDQKTFQCLSVDLNTYADTAAGTTSIAATMCWANAAPSVGQNSMFSCTAASTCCKTTECSEFILCASCPEPQLSGVNRYGCDSLRQMCVCSQVRTSHTRCAFNRECDSTSECELVSSLNGVSYGTIPCANCPNTARLMCLMPPTGMPARCSCMLTGAPSLDLCSDQSGLRTPVDSSRLCGYLHGRRDDIEWAFDMQDLIMIPCAQVSTAVCSIVHRGGGLEPLRMVVAETVRFSTTGRRLLADGQVIPEPGPPVYDAYESEYELADSDALHELLTSPGWNTTAAPCSTLAHAYQTQAPLGLLETHVLHTCAFWRYVGRRVIARYNLTRELGPYETFLLSMDDLVYAVMAPNAGLALLQTPSLFVAAMLHHPWMKPVRAFGVMLANHLEYLTWIRSIDADVHDALFGDLTPEEQAQQVKHEALTRIQARIVPREVPRPRERVAHNLSVNSKNTRRLLTVQDVLSFSARTIQNPNAAGLLPSRVYGAWSSAAFAWPPRYNYSLQACPIALSTLDIGLHVALVNKLYFSNFAAARPVIDRTFRSSLPSFEWAAEPFKEDNDNAARSWSSQAFRWLLGVLGLKPAQFVAFFTTDTQWSLSWILHSLTQCDLASTLTCSRHTRDVILSTIVFTLLLLLTRIMTQILGLEFLTFLLLLSYPWFILWYAYGMPPTCTPLIPACLLSDIIIAVESLVPPQILFPSNLLCDGQNQTCLKSCTELRFINWVDPLAFAICDTDDATCTYFYSLGKTGIAPVDDLLWDPARESMRAFQQVIRSGDVAGHRLCTWVSFVTVVPLLALLASATVLAAALVVTILDLLPTLVTLVCQALVFYES